MRAVMKSVSPRICEKVASGDCTILVSKTAPKQVPFKCYIYCTMPNYKTDWGWQHKPYLYIRDGKLKWIDVAFENIIFYEWAHKKIIGEFVCDKVIKTCGWRLRGDTQQCAKRTTDEEAFPKLDCLTIDEIVKYAGSENREVCGLHISDLKIYDKPKQIREFSPICSYKNDDGSCQYHKVDCLYQQRDYNTDGSINLVTCGKSITRAPSNWQYVEELEE